MSAENLPDEEFLGYEEIETLRERYTPDSIPPCRVCGAKLSIASAGGGNATKYVCSEVYRDGFGRIGTPEGNAKLDHRKASEFYHVRSGDSLVIRLIDEYMDNLKRNSRQSGVLVRQVGSLARRLKAMQIKSDRLWRDAKALAETESADRAALLRVLALAKAWDSGYGPGSRIENVMGKQSLTVETAVKEILKAVHGEEKT